MMQTAFGESFVRTVTAEQAFTDWRKLAEAIRREPVKVVGGGEAAMVVMTEADYEKLTGTRMSLADAIAQPNASDVDFDPPKAGKIFQPADLG